MAESKFKWIQKKSIALNIDDFGHQVLSANKVTGFSINFPIATTCQPSKLCSDTCYGLKGPVSWPSSLTKHMKNKTWCEEDLQGFVDQIYKECSKYLEGNPDFYIRWNGVGDLFEKSVEAIIELNRRLPHMPIWCVTRIPKYAVKLLNIAGVWVHFSLDRSSMQRFTEMKPYYDGSENLFFSYQCEPDEVLERLPKEIRVLFFDSYRLRDENRVWQESPITCPLNLVVDISGTCAKCKRCFSGAARLM